MNAEPRLHVETAAEFADWLEANHGTADQVWLVMWRSGTGRRAPGYEDVVVEALRYGWIDSTARRLDADRTMLRFSPRRPGSGWARPNKERIARLEAEGRMAPAGAAVVAAARADGSWNLFDAVEALEVPDDLAAALDQVDGARQGWEALPASAQKGFLHWIVQAKRSETRRRRVEEVAGKAARGERPW